MYLDCKVFHDISPYEDLRISSFALDFSIYRYPPSMWKQKRYAPEPIEQTKCNH